MSTFGRLNQLETHCLAVSQHAMTALHCFDLEQCELQTLWRLTGLVHPVLLITLRVGLCLHSTKLTMEVTPDEQEEIDALLPFHPLPASEKTSLLGENTSGADDYDQSPIEEVAATVSTADDYTLPVWTFRMWILGIGSCVTLSFLNSFFSYRTEPLTITAISAQIASLPLGYAMASLLPNTEIRLPFTNWKFSLNPGPFNIKEHVLVTIFANAGAASGYGTAYGISVINAIKAFYKRDISLVPSILLVTLTQILGYSWAGLFRKYLVNPAHMWWPSNLVQVSIFRTLHEKESRRGLSRIHFFLIVLVASFSYYVLPGYLMITLTCISIACIIWPNSVTAQQIGSGLEGLGIGAFSFDWASMSAFLGSPLVTPWHSIVCMFVGFALFAYFILPLSYWFNLYDAKTFPLYSSDTFTSDGQSYNVSAIVNSNFELDTEAYEKLGHLNLSTLFALNYGFSFAQLTATLTHVALFHGKEIWESTKQSIKSNRIDIHTKLMKRYQDIPNWWFSLLAFVSIGGSVAMCIIYKNELQLPWWGILLACFLSCTFTLPIGILTATTNQAPGLNVISEYIIGYMLPGKPIANMVFKTYGYDSTAQAVAFLSDFKLGHYMKIPPRSMFIVQGLGTVIAALVNVIVSWWMLNSIDNICDTSKLPSGSPWTCPSDRVFYNASVIWGLVGPKRIFGPEGKYKDLNWFFLGGALVPVIVWLVHKWQLHLKWISLINIAIILNGATVLPPASSVNMIVWFIVGFIFNFYMARFRKQWWRRYNYVLSAALDAGTAFMGVLLYVCLGIEGISLNWAGNQYDYCSVASCPTASGIVVEGCPVS
ncbi:hypothetical protein GOP47_0019920 [Adiantum capillus-veneris]|uniref:Oligopeptide transporter n=1 Tax=Adiantum capillus-veneris TaxID=13818 RepID=A0A9D4UC82_ADICA|nr:hypothetical protein GOP47_0019920 [Adiantum capillus-veneris]